MKEKRIADTAVAHALAYQIKRTGYTYEEFAYHSGIKLHVILNILSGSYKIDIITAEQLEKFTSIPAVWWKAASENKRGCRTGRCPGSR
jgi:ribosome-binding protein aMBF1 (putative translation factor)